MRMEQVFGLRMEQKMKLAPQIIQSIEILQLPLLALEERLATEMTENPVLEVEQPTEETVEAEPTPATPENEPKVEDDRPQLTDLDEDWREYFGRSTSHSIRSVERDRKLDAMQNTAARSMSLQDHLMNQFALLETGTRKREIAENIIFNLDDNGYLHYPLDEIIPSMGNGVTYNEAARVLAAIQTLEPVGVGASSLEECLLFQVGDDTFNVELVQIIIREHLKDVRSNRLPKIARETGRALEEVKRAIEFIITLNPKPGAVFDATETAYIIPDVIVEENNSGGYDVRLEETRLPRLIISPFYRRLLRSNSSSDTKDYIRKKIQSARWLIDSIEQRHDTLLKVAKAIVARQYEFMAKGVEALLPLRMQEIADEVGVHVSTVSRAIAGKYMQTPQGILAMKYFFTGGISNSVGEIASWSSIKQHIRIVIDQEDKKKPLSDEELSVKLCRSGIDVSRRTVTKYRKVMEIPSSRQRRVY